VLLVRLFMSLHRSKPIQLPGADELMSSHAVQKPQITSTNDRLPNIQVLHSSPCRQIKCACGVTSDPASCEPLLVCQLPRHPSPRVQHQLHTTSLILPQTLNAICGDPVGYSSAFSGAYGLLTIKVRRSCIISLRLRTQLVPFRCSCVCFFGH